MIDSIALGVLSYVQVIHAVSRDAALLTVQGRLGAAALYVVAAVTVGVLTGRAR